jgi:hypothetical protein
MPPVPVSGVSRGSVLGAQIFKDFVNNLCDVMNHSDCILIAGEVLDILNHQVTVYFYNRSSL